jgi:hypothetical protein
MMFFGWRPIESCYGSTNPVSSQMLQAATNNPSCSQPAWFWILLGAAVLGGSMSRKK